MWTHFCLCFCVTLLGKRIHLQKKQINKSFSFLFLKKYCANEQQNAPNFISFKPNRKHFITSKTAFSRRRCELQFLITDLKIRLILFYSIIIHHKQNICSRQWKYFLMKHCSCSLIKQMRGCLQLWVCMCLRCYHRYVRDLKIRNNWLL